MFCTCNCKKVQVKHSHKAMILFGYMHFSGWNGFTSEVYWIFIAFFNNYIYKIYSVVFINHGKSSKRFSNSKTFNIYLLHTYSTSISMVDKVLTRTQRFFLKLKTSDQIPLKCHQEGKSSHLCENNLVDFNNRNEFMYNGNDLGIQSVISN